MYEPRIADKITVDLRCDDCPDGARCARCQAIVDAAVADHAVKADSGPCAGLLSTYDVR